MNEAPGFNYVLISYQWLLVDAYIFKGHFFLFDFIMFTKYYEILQQSKMFNLILVALQSRLLLWVLS